MKVVATKENHFHRDLQLQNDSGALQTDAYLDFVRTLKPAVWLRMQGKAADRTLRDEMGNARLGMLHWDGPGNPWVDGRVGRALWLRGPQLKDYAVVPEYPQARRGQLSVSAWVFADSRPNFATIVANGHATDKRGQFQFGLISPIPVGPGASAAHCATAKTSACK